MEVSMVKIYKYHNGCAFFKAVLSRDGEITLTKLPHVPLSIEELANHGINEQLCRVYRVGYSTLNMKRSISYDEHEIASILEDVGMRIDDYIAYEFIGRDCASMNLDPDRSLDGFTAQELVMALRMLNEDKDLANDIRLEAEFARMMARVEANI
jgi:hypothetical protein